MEAELYTYGQFQAAISRLRDSKTERERVLGILELKHVQTLRADLRSEAGDMPRRPNPVYIRAVCTAVYVASQSDVHASLSKSIVTDPNSQRPLSAMLGRYEAYRPSGGGKFFKYPFEISFAENSYIVSDSSKSADGSEDLHDGFAFLVQERVHVLESGRDGLRSMIFRYEPRPGENPVRGIILDAAIPASVNAANVQDEACAANFIAFHESNKRYFGKQVAVSHLTVLLSPGRVGPGIIRA